MLHIRAFERGHSQITVEETRAKKIVFVKSI